MARTRKWIEPVGWPCYIKDCPSGPFIPLEYPDQLCFKSEYTLGPSSEVTAFNAAGEFYHGEGLVQPVEMQVEEDDV